MASFGGAGGKVASGTVAVKGTCSICDEEDVQLYRSAKACTHAPKFCWGCIEKTVKAGVNDKGSINNIDCPEEGCRLRLPVEEALAWLREAKTREKADRILFLQFIRSCDNFRWCMNRRGCGSGVELDGDPDSYSFFSCGECNEKTCVKHKVTWHAGMTCDEYDEQLAVGDKDNANEAWVLANTKPCPRCSTTIEKVTETCDAVSCCMFGDEACLKTKKQGKVCDHGGLCGQRFCWLCLGLIDADGNRHHKPTCRYNCL